MSGKIGRLLKHTQPGGSSAPQPCSSSGPRLCPSSDSGIRDAQPQGPQPGLTLISAAGSPRALSAARFSATLGAMPLSAGMCT